MSLVLVIMSLLMGMMLKIYTDRSDSAALQTVNQQMDDIEDALFSYRDTYLRLPCPADPTLAATSASFGVSASTAGTCSGSNLLQYPASSPTHKAGAVPVKALGLPDSAAIDPWGRKYMYVVQLAATGTNAFTTYSAYDTTIGNITIYDESGTGTPRSARALYVLLSFGKNGHGGYFAGAGTSRMNARSVNTAELQNCACTSAAANNNPNLNIAFYQKSYTPDPTNVLNIFDDIVRYKTRMQLATPSELP
jgi:type II secretory pathway pseudopilin PulG